MWLTLCDVGMSGGLSLASTQPSRGVPSSGRVVLTGFLNSDYDDEYVSWACTADLPREFKLGSTDVLCEGFFLLTLAASLGLSLIRRAAMMVQTINIS